jgi:hypothetical protein
MTEKPPLLQALAATMAILALIPTGIAWSQSKPKKLSANEIRAQIIGNVLTDGIHWRRHFRRNGTLASVDMGKSNIGRWKIQGNQLCFAVQAGEDFDCYEILASGKEVHLHVEDTGYDLEARIEKP